MQRSSHEYVQKKNKGPISAPAFVSASHATQSSKPRSSEAVADLRSRTPDGRTEERRRQEVATSQAGSSQRSRRDEDGMLRRPTARVKVESNRMDSGGVFHGPSWAIGWAARYCIRGPYRTCGCERKPVPNLSLFGSPSPQTHLLPPGPKPAVTHPEPVSLPSLIISESMSIA